MSRVCSLLSYTIGSGQTQYHFLVLSAEVAPRFRRKVRRWCSGNRLCESILSALQGSLVTFERHPRGNAFGTQGHDSSHIRKVKAGMEPVPAAYAKSHHEELRQLYNTSHWPKHVLLQYTWYEQVEVDTNRGLIVLLGGGAQSQSMCICSQCTVMIWNKQSWCCSTGLPESLSICIHCACIKLSQP